MKVTPAAPARRNIMGRSYEGLPPAVNVEQSIILAQLRILRRLEAVRAGIAPTVVTQAGAAPEVVESWSPAQE
jgi:hypothetical protein